MIRRLAALGGIALVAATGCAVAKRDVKARDYWPTKSEWKRSTLHALKDRGTWVPAAGAALMAIDDWDRRLSDWAVENTPLFGSNEHAREASDNLRTATTVAMIGTALAVPNGPGPWEFKPERMLLELGGLRLGAVLTGLLKDATDRVRPDGSDDRSFPSGHASESFTFATFACRNVDGIPGLSKSGRIALKTSFRAMAAGTAWARVEGGRHYPADVLFGAALGNFVAVFVHEAFLPSDSRVRFSAFVTTEETYFAVTWSF